MTCVLRNLVFMFSLMALYSPAEGASSGKESLETKGKKSMLIVYYSRTGNTRLVSEALSKKSGATLEELKDQTDRSGPIGYILGGRDAWRKKLTTIDPVKQDTASFDKVIVATPIWAATMAPALRTYLEEHKHQIQAYAVLTTSGGTGPTRTAQDCEAILGKPPVAVLGIKEKEIKNGSYEERLNEFLGRVGNVKP